MNVLQTWTRDELCLGLGISDYQLRQLIRDGRIGFIRGKRGQHRFTETHVAQAAAALEVHPRQVDDQQIPGLTATSARRRRKSA